MTTIAPDRRERFRSIDVLHVDDEPDEADVVGTYLERKDDRINVRPATGAGEGLDRLAGADVDCVVSDYDMPGKTASSF
jgi:CheY-like chemotaxis protein